MSGAPGLSFQSVLDQAPLSYIRTLLGEQACELVDLIRDETHSEETLRKAAASAISPEQLINDPAQRARLLRLVPGDKQDEFADRLGKADGTAAHDFLARLPWTAEQRRIFLGLVVDRAPAPPPAFHSRRTSAYGLFLHQLLAAAWP